MPGEKYQVRMRGRKGRKLEDTHKGTKGEEEAIQRKRGCLHQEWKRNDAPLGSIRDPYERASQLPSVATPPSIGVA